MSTFKSASEITIPKIFEHQNYIFHLKRELKGNLTVFTSNTCQFKGDSGRIIIDKKKVLEDYEMESLLRKKIVDAYFNNIGTCNEISKEESVFFNLIDYVLDKNKSKPRVLFIGYKFNYPDTIRDTLQRANLNCDTLILEQNIELYNPRVRLVDNNCDPIFKMITDKVEMGRYDNYVVDIPNLALMTNEYTNTKRLLSYLKSKNKKMIILNSGTITKFNRLFGNDYDDMIMDEKSIIRCGNHETIKRQIKTFLL